jgi:hypothetical protein
MRVTGKSLIWAIGLTAALSSCTPAPAKQAKPASSNAEPKPEAHSGPLVAGQYADGSWSVAALFESPPPLASELTLTGYATTLQLCTCPEDVACAPCLPVMALSDTRAEGRWIPVTLTYVETEGLQVQQRYRVRGKVYRVQRATVAESPPQVGIAATEVVASPAP